MIFTDGISNPASIKDVAAVAVGDTATSHTITSGRKGVTFQNVGSNPATYGGATINPATNQGCVLYPRAYLPYQHIKEDFVIYFRCASGLSTTIAVVEYD